MSTTAATAPGITVLEAVNVHRTFGSRRMSITALDGVDVRVCDDGTCTGIVGESGSGKSTLARMLAGLVPPSSGTITFNGTSCAMSLSTRSGVTETGEPCNSSGRTPPPRSIRAVRCAIRSGFPHSACSA